MHSFAARYASFNVETLVDGQTPSIIPRDTVAWPHPQKFGANPETLADAGFYHNPSPYDPDNVCCFMCGKELAEWEEHDDPFKIHAEKCPKCPWVVLNFAVAGSDVVESSPSTKISPTSNILYEARLATYGPGGKRKWWPHDGRKKHGANSKKMTAAGFIFQPEIDSPEDDTATCLYCETTLSGWESTDDPLHEHSRRPAAKTCAFIIALNTPESPASDESSGAENQHKRVTRSMRRTSQQQQPLTPLNTVPENGEPDAKPKTKRKTAGTKKQKEDVAPAAVVEEKTKTAKPATKQARKRGRPSAAALQVQPLKNIDPNTKKLNAARPYAPKEPVKPREPPKLTESKQDTLFPPNLKLVLDNRYKLIDKLGNGAFGQVYRADDTKHSKLVAVKLEPYNAEYASLRYEIDVYRTLRRGMGGKPFPVGIPEMIWGGSHEGIYRALVLPLLGSSLTSLFRAQKHQLSLGTTLMLVQQMIDRLEWIHDQRIIHRDIKPDNFVMGTGKNSRTLYLIDFGLSKVYRNEEWMHIPYRDGRGFVGNMRYASVNVHLGVEPARRDDLEAVFYVLLDFLTGDLPWRRFENPPESNMIYVTKLTSIQALNFSMGAYYEPEFYQCLWYIRSLRFDQRPDYNYLRATLSALAERKGVGLGECFDWER